MLFTIRGSVAQNIVPNPGFEQYTACPYYVSQIDFAPPWNKPTEGTSDYLNQCATSLSFVSVPSNQFGNQPAKNGNGYAGFYAFWNNLNPAPPVADDIREYIQAPLITPMVAGKAYKVEFYVSLSDYSKYATDAIGLFLSVTPPSRSDKLAINRIPQVKNPAGNFLSDKNGWTRVNECIIADSAYQYITIGNFNNGLNTPVQFVNSIYLEHYCYYFIDDVSIEELLPPDLGNDTVLCEGSSLTLDAGPGTSSYSWTTGETTQTISVNVPGIYIVTKYNECTLTDTIVVSYSDGPAVDLGPDTSIATCRNEVRTLDASSPMAISYYWSTGEATASIEIVEPGSYIITVLDSIGCSSSDEITLTEGCEPLLFIPDSFTPNNDGRNDLFKAISSYITKAELSIYNRWGQLVYNTNNLDEGWDGKLQKADCPQGIYMCRVSYEVTSGKKKSLTGRIMLLR